MAIYQEYEDETGAKHAEYNFTYLDRVMDAYRRLGLRPFLELGFMPKKLASGTQTMFYWASNVTPPADYEAWCALVQATLRHLMDPLRRGRRCDLAGRGLERAQPRSVLGTCRYGRIFPPVCPHVPRRQGGGRALPGGRPGHLRCGRQALAALLPGVLPRRGACAPTTSPATTIPSSRRSADGHYGYPKLSDRKPALATLQASRDIVDSFAEFRGLPIHVTEFNTSYSPTTPLHDTNLNAAYIAHQLSRLGDCNESYSYWTFGDVFEESGVPFTPFLRRLRPGGRPLHPKPTFWTFAFFKKLQGTCVHRSQQAVVVRGADGRYRGVAWNTRYLRVGAFADLCAAVCPGGRSLRDDPDRRRRDLQPAESLA